MMKRLVPVFLFGCLLALFMPALTGAADSASGGKRQEGKPLRIMAYNIRTGLGMDNKRSLERVAEVIKKFKPDLLALQEIDRNCLRSGGVDIAAELGKMLGMEHRFGKFMDFEGGEYGLAVLSSLPIVETVRHQLPDGAEPRCALEVRVKLDELKQPLSFISIHNDWTSSEFRLAQVEALLGAIAKKDNPLILAGDFNGDRKDPSLRKLADSGLRIMAKKGEQKTWPAGKPRIEIDFIMMKNMPPVEVEHWVVDERLASDHRPVVAEVRF